MFIGHQKQWSILLTLAERKKIPHALLFWGPEKIGKKTVAIEFVKFLFCEAEEVKPCGNCRNCQDVERKNHPDFLLLSPDLDSGEISISSTKNLIWKLSLSPFSAVRKIAIIDQCHCMNSAAQNAFLKFLEEPPSDTLLFLVSEYPSRLFPTILSRLQKLRFSPLSDKMIKEYLADQKFSKKNNEPLLSFFEGKAGKISEYLQNSPSFEREQKVIQDLAKLMKSDLGEKFSYVKNFHDQNDREKKEEMLKIWLKHIRSAFLSQIQGKADKKEFAPGRYAVPKLKQLLRAIDRTIGHLSTTNVNEKLLMELLLMEL